ncbi:MAG: spore coat protein U domain-containing protein [Proteobacteria bacterium]|uniref:Csu type fimbrial protein n=1 Tax=Rudaea sp. TaxID=2136325 RepID=UPI0032203E1F|nr:spore coat protein U domain-containing protein [Pseudomonadota bacterium]
MKIQLALAAILATAAASIAAPALAATATGQFNVKLTVTSTCSVVSTTDLDFGSQASTATNVTANNGSVTVACSKNTPYTIGLLPSAANGGTTNGTGFMKSATTSETVAYSLFQDAASTVWGNTTGTGGNVKSGNRGSAATANQTYTVYGKIASMDVTPATDYKDVVAVTVTY